MTTDELADALEQCARVLRALMHDSEAEECEEAATRLRELQGAVLSPEEQDAINAVYEAARGLCYGFDWNNGTHAKRHKAALIAAVDAIEPLPDRARVREAGAQPTQGAVASDRSALLYLMQQFDGQVHVCERCGEEDETKNFDSAVWLRDYLASHPAPVGVTEEKAFPKHIALDIQHNDHATVYEHVAEWVAHNDWCDWVSEDEKQRAIATNSVWTVRWYPDTPVGFCAIAASTLDAALEAAGG